MIIGASGFPLDPRSNGGLAVDPSSDAWAEIISGIGPLILLVGERTTKQLLRSVRAYYSALSIGTAPLGLLAVVTSLIRFCGIQKLRAFIGYELEARSVAGIEYTQLNCGGVHAEMVDGHLIRSASANPSSQVAAVSYLQGDLDEDAQQVELQIQSCARFENERQLKGIPKLAVDVRWVLWLRSRQATDRCVSKIIRALIGSLLLKDKAAVELRAAEFCLKMANGTSRYLSPPTDGQATNTKSETGRSGGSEVLESRLDVSPGKNDHGMSSEKTRIGVKMVSSNSSHISLEPTSQATESKKLAEAQEIHPLDNDLVSPQLTFTYTLNAVSEFLAKRPVSKSWSLFISLLSLATILAIYILALRNLKWKFSVAWLLLVLGYFGIVFGVSFAAMIISTSCTVLRLDNKSARHDKSTKTSKSKWTDGVVNSVKNTDSMDTTGSEFLSSGLGPQNLEAVWLRPLSRERAMLASSVACGIVVFFLCHYIGLRSSIWWVALGELGVCLLAALARSLAKGEQARFTVQPGIKIDKRCCSTGIIEVQKGRIVEERSRQNVDARAYSTLSFEESATDGETIAWETARLCSQNPVLVQKILELTEMVLHVVPSQDNNDCDVLIAFGGGLLVSEGLAFPNCQVMLAFHSTISALSTPTALLARGIMRQPEWVLDKANFGPVPLGKVYVLAIDGMISWWTVSEDRNEMSDLQKNLQWCFMLINISFFLSLLDISKNGKFPLGDIERVHSGSSQANRNVAQEVFQFLQSCL
jgi:hypothetical protein